MPDIIELPDLIRCEYAQRRGWPSTFRKGSRVCAQCDQNGCRFHYSKIKKIEARTPRFLAQPEQHHEPDQQASPKAVEHEELNPRDLTSDIVLEHFPSPSLRPFQKDIMTRAVDAFRTGKKCVILAAPVGFGKSYVNTAFTSVTRSFYATPQLALIDQIMNDPHLRQRFVEIRGRRNYRCYYPPHRRVDVGKCVTEGYRCQERFEVCPYWIQKRVAVSASSILTNLSYLASESQTEGSESYLGSRSLMVLDEAHNLEEQCLNQVSVRVTPFTIPYEVYNEVLPQLLDAHRDSDVKLILDAIEDLLKNILDKSKTIAETTGLSAVQADDLDKIDQYLSNYKLYKKSKSEWVWQVRNDQLTVQPVFGREFIRDLVWKRAEYYIISSATILNPREFAENTGLLDFLKQDEISFLTVPSTFPVANRPVIDATVGPLSTQYLTLNMPKAVRAVEEILDKEQGSVAIHCFSYRHQKALVESISEHFKPRLIVHSSRDREEKLNEWKRSRGKVFVSVAFSEGQDWKYDLCDAQILLKVPFPDLGDKRVKRRLEMGHRAWYQNQAMLEVIQSYGRAIRAEDDMARFYIVDGSFSRLARECWQVIPDWFKEALPSSFTRSGAEHK